MVRLLIDWLFCVDILTPLPAMGVDFTIIPGKGPKIVDTVRQQADIDRIKVLEDVDSQVPFLGPILKVLVLLIMVLRLLLPLVSPLLLLVSAQRNTGQSFSHRLYWCPLDFGSLLC